MLTQAVIIIAIALGSLLLRTVCDAVVVYKRLRIRFTKKLLSIALLSNTLAFGIVAIISIPLIEYTWAIFPIQILFLMAIEVPLYQIFYRTRSWYDLAMTLLISRFLFAFIASGIGIITILILRGSLQELL